ncbi:GntR family transcriptional regulator [uncultured Clostridium sp.]|uniref:GntR family transcriptional regulator n=1 Tax=uncultured Clostridium sp. TaxID=59620 RepID=UPI0025F4FD76|nr:GntR family transcriptional regulator [uncultured Clostridium sp.]MDU2491216.1 GntR family transcriptional regulator [Clostridium celatum]MDU4884167.1 GntR family transcriptional regulator [Clostridium celatum]MDU7077376.1 GntR family transcriptional regulator [Clostridium celatum]
MNKYEVIAMDIREDILKGVYKPNERLPFEKEICNKYNVSKMTVKKSLDLLVAEGLIVKRRGSGTFIKDITEKEIHGIIDKKQFSGLTNNNLGHKVTSKVLDFKVINADKEVADILKIEEGDFIYFIHRVRYVDNDPMVIERTYMPLSIIPGIKMTDIEGSIYSYIKGKLGLKIQSAHSTIRARKSEELDRKYLKLTEYEPIIEVERVAYLESGKAFEYSFARHRYDKYEFKTITVI